MAELLVQRRRIGRDGCGQICDCHAVGEFADCGEFGIEMAIDENESWAGHFFENIFFQRVLGCGIGCWLEYRPERQPGNRRDIGETPVFVLQRRETEFGEARQARLAQRQQPGRVDWFRLETAEFFPKQFGGPAGFFLCGRRHICFVHLSNQDA